MAEPLRIAMLGYRFMGRAHANALARLPMFFPEVPASRRDILIGRDEQALATAARELGFGRTTTNWERAIEDVDVLYNLGPNHLHEEPSIAALRAGVHVFCEKPLAHRLDAAERMLSAARRSSAIAGIAFNYRYVPAIQYAKELIADGVIGEIHHVRGRYLQDWLVDPEVLWSWRNAEELAGSGALGDLGSHLVDLTRFLVGDSTGPVTDVAGHLQTFVDERPAPNSAGRQPVTVDDAFSAQAKFESGAMATFEASRFATGAKNDLTIEVNGSRGSLRFGLERLNELEVCEEGDRGYKRILVTDEQDPYIDHWWPPGHTLGWEHTFVHENAAFLSAIVSDRAHNPSFEDGYRAQALLDAIQRSDDTQEWVTVQ